MLNNTTNPLIMHLSFFLLWRKFNISFLIPCSEAFEFILGMTVKLIALTHKLKCVHSLRYDV